ncbi:MAG TPA: hypothetical protein VFL59_01670 [Candidatus Nanopelagicales bacterium]|nr:hypothetical protein [Candidatus Nanopelagicales bacterium]
MTTVLLLVGVCSAMLLSGATPHPQVGTPVTPRGSAGLETTVVADDVLPGVLKLPVGPVPLKPPTRSEDIGDLHRWEVDLDLSTVGKAAAIAAVKADLRAAGFAVRASADDVFGMRLRGDRWEIVVARVSTRGSGEDVTNVLTIGVGSRPA